MSNENESIVNDELPQPTELPKEMTRRDAVQLLASIPVAAFLKWPTADQSRIRELVNDALRGAAEGTPFAPKFFTAAEYRTVGILANMIIPRDERSGSATDAGVPEFMDFTMVDRPNSQQWMRDGLGVDRRAVPIRASESRSPTPASPSGKRSSTTLRGPRAHRPRWRMAWGSSTDSGI